EFGENGNRVALDHADLGAIRSMQPDLRRSCNVAPNAHVVREVGIEDRAIGAAAVREPCHPGAIEPNAVDVRGDRIPLGRREVGDAVRLVHTEEAAYLPTSGRDLFQHVARSAVAVQMLEAAALAEPEE